MESFASWFGEGGVEIMLGFDMGRCCILGRSVLGGTVTFVIQWRLCSMAKISRRV